MVHSLSCAATCGRAITTRSPRKADFDLEHAIRCALLQQRLGITSIYVTHDQVEAMSISDQLVIFNSGKVEQIGSPREVYTRPANRFVADFIGKANFVPATVAGPDAIEVAGVRIDLSDTTPVPTGAESPSSSARSRSHLYRTWRLSRHGAPRHVPRLDRRIHHRCRRSGRMARGSSNPAEAGFWSRYTVFVTLSRPSIHLLHERA